METKTIVQLACLAATTAFYSIMLFTQKARRAKVLEKAGDLLYELTKPAKSKAMMTLFAIPCVLAFAFLVDYGAYFFILVCAICALAVFIVCKEDACSVNTGIYKNALIAGGSYIEWSKIKKIKEGQYLEIALVDGKKITIQTASPEENKQVLEALDKARQN